MYVSNKEFLSAIFKKELKWCHVTDFMHDPLDIPDNEHMISWCGDYQSRYKMSEGSNQFFTISCFFADENGKARRRKALFRQTHCIVLDDVREKLPIQEVENLPEPSWILETSNGSEQWGYILDRPCKDRHRVENLLDGLVANGLAPSGKDPGMKGVTRYVRLPEGFNRKASKMVEGLPFKCTMLSWNPKQTARMEDLAKPFTVNLDMVRRDARDDGAAEVANHPVINIPDILTIKAVRSAGRFEVTCPWITEHTKKDDNGAVVFTNKDNSIGFKCHHGSCESRTGNDLLKHIEASSPGFIGHLTKWQTVQTLSENANKPADAVPMAAVEAAVQAAMPELVSFRSPENLIESLTPEETMTECMTTLMHRLRAANPDTQEGREEAGRALKVIDKLSSIDKIQWHNQVRQIMRWTKVELRGILKEARAEWYQLDTHSFNEHMIFVTELNQFYDYKSRLFLTPDAFQNAFCHLDDTIRKTTLEGSEMTKVQRLDYAPKKPPVFKEMGIIYGNTWSDDDELHGEPGDVSRWLTHWDEMGWGEHRKHMIQWMAFTVRHPDIKINHMMMLGSSEGGGKDFLLYPLIKALNSNSTTIAGEELMDDYDDYLLSTKHLHVNETELGDLKESKALSARLKPMGAAPPDRLNVNQKFVKRMKIRNIISVSMTTNSTLPIKVLHGPTRRIFAVWSNIDVRSSDGNTTDKWKMYWNDRWNWMTTKGVEHCIYYLRNTVDLSDFSPATPPPVTEFLRDISDMSKSRATQTVEEFIGNRIGLFSADLITLKDAMATLKAGVITHPHLTHCDSRKFSSSETSKLLGEVRGCRRIRTRGPTGQSRLWCVRNIEKYERMTDSQIYEEQQNQRAAAIRSAPGVLFTDG